MENNITKNSTINVFGAQFDDEELSEIKTSLDNSWIGMGAKVKEFEKQVAKRNNLPGMVMVDSGSNALHLAIKLLNLRPQSTIIVPSFTWVACANAVKLAGHKLIFADVDYDTQNITKQSIDKIINDDVTAIMAVHYAGKPCNMQELKTFGIPIIEDAAHAIDSKIDNVYCGNMGDVGIYSFDSIKNLPTPEGGAILGNEKILNQARQYRYCGVAKSGFTNVDQERWWESEVQHIWAKMLPNDISASIGLVQLKKLDLHQKRRKDIWDRYQQELKLPWILQPINPDKHEQHSYFTYLIRAKNKRDDLAQYLLRHKVYTTLRYQPLHLNRIYNCHKQYLPVCEQLNKEGLNLPLHPGMTDSDIEKVIGLIRLWKN